MKRIFKKALDLFLPPRCLKCNEITSNAHEFCEHCWPLIHFLTTPWCNICGLPFSFSMDSDGICDECFQTKPPIVAGRSVIAYDDFSASIILKLKHGDATYLAEPIALFMFKRAGPDFFQKCDGLVPIPLHWRRLIKRKFNQTVLIAQHLSRQSQVPFLSNVLKKSRATPSQEHKTRKQRFQNVKGSFRVVNAESIKGKHLILIDDVWTTGATLYEAARILLDGGAASVKALTFARITLFQKGPLANNSHNIETSGIVPW